MAAKAKLKYDPRDKFIVNELLRSSKIVWRRALLYLSLASLLIVFALASVILGVPKDTQYIKAVSPVLAAAVASFIYQSGKFFLESQKSQRWYLQYVFVSHPSIPENEEKKLRRESILSGRGIPIARISLGKTAADSHSAHRGSRTQSGISTTRSAEHNGNGKPSQRTGEDK